jgi:hypothetical protein
VAPGGPPDGSEEEGRDQQAQQAPPRRQGPQRSKGKIAQLPDGWIDDNRPGGEPSGSGDLLPRAWHEDDQLTDLDRAIGQILLGYGPNGHYPSMADIAEKLAKAGRSVTSRWVRARIRHMEGLGYVERRPVWEVPDDPAWTKREQRMRQLGRQTSNEYRVRVTPRPPSSSGDPPEVTSGQQTPPEVAIAAGQPPGSGAGPTGESVPPLTTEGTAPTGFEVVTGSVRPSAGAAQPSAVLQPSGAAAPPDALYSSTSVAQGLRSVEQLSAVDRQEPAKKKERPPDPHGWRRALGLPSDPDEDPDDGQKLQQPPPQARPPPGTVTVLFDGEDERLIDDEGVAEVLFKLQEAGMLETAQVVKVGQP